MSPAQKLSLVTSLQDSDSSMELDHKWELWMASMLVNTFLGLTITIFSLLSPTLRLTLIAAIISQTATIITTLMLMKA